MPVKEKIDIPEGRRKVHRQQEVKKLIEASQKAKRFKYKTENSNLMIQDTKEGKTSARTRYYLGPEGEKENISKSTLQKQVKGN